jgi:hypothetical protein
VRLFIIEGEKRMLYRKKIPFLVLTALLISFANGLAQESQVRVIVERARIYAESSTDSYRIETVGKGTILTLFGIKQADESWLYVHYKSPRWGSEVTGFIQAEMVEEMIEAGEAEGKPEKRPEEGTEQKQEEKKVKKQEEKQVEKPMEKPKAKVKEKLEEEPARTDRVLGITAPEEQNVIPFPLSFPLWKNPRIYQMTTEEEQESGVLPAGTKPAVQPKDAIKTEIWEKKVVVTEKTEVTEKERNVQKAEPAERMEQPPEIARRGAPESNPLFTLSLGYGPSLGGFGGFIQLNTSGSLSVHWGFGYYPTSMFYPDFDWVKGKAMYSVGIKYYLPWRSDQVRPYIDLQYGGISVEAVRVVTGIWYYTYIYEDIQKTLWGPSLLAGIELRFGSFGLNGAVGGSYVVTEWEYWDQPLFFTADIGFLLYF